MRQGEASRGGEEAASDRRVRLWPSGVPCLQGVGGGSHSLFGPPCPPPRQQGRRGLQTHVRKFTRPNPRFTFGFYY